MENALMINTNVYEFTFKVRGYGANPDEAFLALQDAISDDLGIVFTNLQSFEQVPKEEADEARDKQDYFLAVCKACSKKLKKGQRGRKS
jgi:hypothetical protein